ncbi:arsenite transport protein [Haemophilus influenzae]|nr:arsenite transport protein [Haemophilus influenzae]
MGLFERFLSLWVALAIVLGVVFGCLVSQCISMGCIFGSGSCEFACGDTDLADDLSDDDSD